MDFRIADTFTASLARLNGAEQKAAKTTAFDLQLNASAPGLQFQRVERSRDPNFWSVRVNDDIRLIIHRKANILLCFVGHHDAAYGWAERRKIERHPVTGAAQLVELPERVEIAAVPSPTARPRAGKPPLFASIADDALLGYGVPPEWLDAVRRADEDSLFDIADHLPQEATEALPNLATGAAPQPPPPAPAAAEVEGHRFAPRFLAALGPTGQARGLKAHGRPDGLFFAGDLGQRIFQQPFSWRSLGVDVRGRSPTLRINYRTSHQSRAQADRLLPAAIAMWTATRRIGAARSRSSTVRLPPSRS
jgi:hypothetical protein